MTATATNISEKLNLESALWYASRGFFVFPLYEISHGQCSCYAGSRCGAPGKHPRTARGYKDASNDPVQITKWFKKWPGAGVGVAAGMSQLVILDIDPRNRGDDTLARLQSEHGTLPHTPRVLTGGGGVHYYFRKPPGDFDGFVLGQGVDVKADGGYVVAPPTMHISGLTYRADPDAHIAYVPLADLPTWIIAPKKKAKRTSSARVSEGFLGAAMEAAGWLGKAMGVDRTAIKCPWEQFHTSGKSLDGSTVVFAPVDGSRTGWAHCSHSHCADRTQQDWLSVIPEEAKTIARERLGMDENYEPKPGAAPPPARPEDWVKSLRHNSDGILYKDAGNVELILTNDDNWRECLAYDEFRGQKVWLRQPAVIAGMRLPQLGQVMDEDTTFVQHKLGSDRGVSFPIEAIRAGIDGAARNNPFHPVREYLEELTWDKIPRVSRWLATYMGAADTPYTRLVSRWWLICAVARAFNPGCKADSILILEGPQGVGKSTALRILGGQWFSDTGIDIGNKDAFMAMRGKWIIELAELESLSRADADRIKSFFTSPTDTYRPPYGREVIDVPRQCVFAGSVNHNEYLHDETGGRRFWPVACGKIDLKALERDRDQLWAEARQAYEEGLAWWPTTPEEAKLCSTEQTERYVQDEWEGVLSDWIAERSKFTMREALELGLQFRGKEWSRSDEARVTRCLKRLGYYSKKTKAGRTWQR